LPKPIANPANTCIIHSIESTNKEKIMKTLSNLYGELSIATLTTAQKREAIKLLRTSIAADVMIKKQERFDKAEAKAEAKAAKVTAAIQKAEARLQKLLDMKVGAVGSKARKFAKRPSKAIVTVGA
jgi:hypothetical protein